MRKVLQYLGKTFGVIVLIALVVALSPVLLSMFVGQGIGHLWFRSRLRSTWPPDKFVLLAYTDSPLWAPYLEAEVMPSIKSAAIIINRSEPDWKRKYPLEARALAFWGRFREYNPIAVVLGNMVRVKVVRFYKAFEQHKHGNSTLLEERVREFLAIVRDLRQSAT